MEKPFNPKPQSFKNTFCVFEERKISEIENLKLNYESKSGSKYFYANDGMYRLSNHWGRLANSKWRLISSNNFISEDKCKLGFAKFSNFLIDNNFDKLYYLEHNPLDNTINYQHKLNQNFDGKPILRTSLETTKRIKQARNILNLTNWAKYFEYDNLDDLRIKIINELIFTEKSLEQIKKEIYGTQ